MAGLPSHQRPLTPKQREFVKQYLVLRDGAKAAVAAGYSAKRAAVEASELLQRPQVKRELGKAMQRLEKVYGAQLAVAMEELYHALTARASDYFDDKGRALLPHELSARADAAAEGFEYAEIKDPRTGKTRKVIKVKRMSKAAAIDMALKIRGAYAPEKHITASAHIDFSTLYGKPENALAPDVIPDPPDPVLEVKPSTNGKH